MVVSVDTWNSIRRLNFDVKLDLVVCNIIMYLVSVTLCVEIYIPNLDG